ncbi:MAG: ATP-binding protein [Kofleriaceae bacterium]
MRTLSARILLGFAALTVTFAVVTATVAFNMGLVQDQVQLITSGYYKLALTAGKLRLQQEQLQDHVEDIQTHAEDLWRDGVAGTVTRSTLRRARDVRNRQVNQIQTDLKSIEKSVDIAAKHFASDRPKIEALQQAVANTASLYTSALTVPKPPPGPDAAAQLLTKLRAAESDISAKASQLASSLETSTRRKTSQMVENVDTVRTVTIYLGLTAVALGLLITIWVVITLRPLRKLRDGAKRVAAGDYASRIEVKGPAEVADLAREFNAMGHAVQERERELKRSEQLAGVGKMAAVVSHEIRNPLSSIGLNTELIEEELGTSDDTREARSLCQAIHREVDRLTTITEEYLAFARRPKPKLAPESVNGIVDSLVVFVREDLAAREVALSTDLASDDPIAMIDAAQIRQCLINLVRNAADAVNAKGSGKVTVRTRSGNPVIIEVADDGVGIAPGDLPRLFDAFFSTKEGGNGLGLALTLQIIHDHGGTIDVESTVGQGTTFTVRVPRYIPAAAVQPPTTLAR